MFWPFELNQLFFKSGTDYNMTMWERMAPQSLRTVIEAYAELVNAPRIGCYDNYMWSSCQLNVAELQRALKGSFVVPVTDLLKSHMLHRTTPRRHQWEIWR